MNLTQIKNSGLLLGLESELANQQRNLDHSIKERKWDFAFESAGNIRELLTEIVSIKLHAKPEVKTPSIDDLDERIANAS